jgi:two-component system chemotaxis response regulator CheY
MQRILIADDAPFSRETLREIIEPLGYEVVAEAASGLEAVELFALYQPDLVTVDLVMPKGSGVDATRMILNRFPAARIVVASALGQETLVAEALDAGAVNSIAKPYQPEAVERVLAQELEKSEPDPQVLRFD